MTRFVLLSVTAVLLAQVSALGAETQGRWVGPCVHFGFGSLRSTLEYSGDQKTETINLHMEGECLEANLVSRTVYLQTISMGKTSPAVPTATEVDETMESVMMTYFFDQDGIDKLNKKKYCNQTDWEVGVPNDVTGETCGTSEMAVKGDRTYDLISVNDKLELFQGMMTDENNGKSPEKRPTELNTAAKYTKIR